MKTEHIPISLLAFADAGYKTVYFSFPCFGSSKAKTLPVAANEGHKDKHLPLQLF